MVRISIGKGRGEESEGENTRMRKSLRMYGSSEVPSWAGVWGLREARSRWGGDQGIVSNAWCKNRT